MITTKIGNWMREAGEAGDLEAYAICQIALHGEVIDERLALPAATIKALQDRYTQDAARAEVERWIADRDAQIADAE